MYLPITPQRSCAAAWLDAFATVNAERGREAHNVIIDIAEPLTVSAADARVIALADSFLREHEKLPVQAVANTIFPEALYTKFGAPAFIEKFHANILPKIRRTNRWSGYYFERMTAYPTQGGEPLNQLWGIVERIRDDGNRSLNKFELSLFDPERDIDNSPYGGQCLSFLSFKLLRGTEKKLALTAMYRNHYYIEKLLGNLVGLGRLMGFIANEGGIGVGPLTVVSTHAVIDQPRGAQRGDVNDLLVACQAAQTESEAA